MDAAATSVKQQQVNLAAELRQAGRTWVEIAQVFQQRFRLNPRTALRVARGWSQARAAEEWNRRWPDQPKTLKNFSYWEIWPGRGGYALSPDNLVRLAETYECNVSDLLSDLPTFRHLDTQASPSLAVAQGSAEPSTGEMMISNNAETLLLDLLDRKTGSAPYEPPPAAPGSLLHRPEQVDLGELAQVIVMWTQRIPRSLDRRELLNKLTAALAVAAATPLAGLPWLDGQPPSEAIPSRYDPLTLEHCEAMVTQLRKQGDVLGAAVTLPSTLAYRRVAEQLARAAPSSVKERAISAYAELTQLAGWLCFNMGDHPAAERFYDDARSAAHDARDIELVTYILCTMSHLATEQGKPRVGIDHAVAASAWAEQTSSAHARGYAADVAVRAFIADGQAGRSADALERERAALQTVDQVGGPRKSWWYFYDESFYWSTNAQHALKFQGAQDVLNAIDQSLALIDQGNLHNRSIRLLYKAEAFVRQDHIGLACETLTDVVALTSINTTRRIDQRVKALRVGLEPWRRTRAVRELDQAIGSYRAAPVSGKGSTNTTYSR